MPRVPRAMAPTHQQRLSHDPAGQTARHPHLHRSLSHSFSKQVDLEEKSIGDKCNKRGDPKPQPCMGGTSVGVPLSTGAYVGHPAATEAGVDVDVGFRDLLAEPTRGKEALQQGGFSVTGTAAPGEDHRPCLHHTRQVGHEPQHLGPGREKLWRDGDGRRGDSSRQHPRVP